MPELELMNISEEGASVETESTRQGTATSLILQIFWGNEIHRLLRCQVVRLWVFSDRFLLLLLR